MEGSMLTSLSFQGVYGFGWCQRAPGCILARTCDCIYFDRHTTDLEAIYIWRAKKKGVKLAAETDAHGSEEFFKVRCGVSGARGWWCARADVYSTPASWGWAS
jgi:hypothetical protein